MAKNRIINIVYKVNRREIEQAEASTAKVKRATQDLNKEIKNTESVGTKAFNALGAAVAAVGIGALIKKTLELGAAQQQLNIAFTTFLKDANKAKTLIAELTKFSIVTPFTPDQVNRAAKTLLAFGLEANKIIPTLKRLGDVSAGTGKDLAEMAVIFGQIRSTGRLMGQDLLQLINAGFNPLQVISQETGKSVASLKKEMEDGLITFEMVDDAFKSATEEGGLFFNLMEKQSQSISGKWSTISGNIEEAAKGIFESNVTIIDTLVTKLTQYTDAFLKILQLANSDPISERSREILESYTTTVDSAGEKTDMLEQAISDISKSGNTKRANDLYVSLTKGINEYEESVLFLQKEIASAHGDEFKRLNSLLQVEQLTIKLLSETRNKLQNDAVQAELKRQIEKQTKEDELRASAKDKEINFDSTFFNLKQELADKFEKQFQDSLKQSNKEQESILKDSYDRQFDQLVAKNERELEELERKREEERRREKEHQDNINALKRAGFDFGIDLIGASLLASMDRNDNELRDTEDFYNQQIAAAGNNEQRRQELELQREQAVERARKKEEEREKNRVIKGILLEGLLNAVKALGLPPIPGANFIAAAKALGFSVIQATAARGFNEGVIDLDGPGTETSDSIPAWLSRRESVMTADETKSSIGILKDIRAKKLNDRIFEKIKIQGGSVVASLDDRRIVSAIEKSRVDYARQGSTLYEHRRVSETLTRKTRSKILSRP